MNSSPNTVIPLLLILGAVALWWSGSVAARDRAIAAARDLCSREGWQLLDETVALAGLRPTRVERGLSLDRRYRFEFSTGDGERSDGGVRMIGQRIHGLWADAPDGRMIETRPDRLS